MKSVFDLPRLQKQIIAAMVDLFFLPLAFCFAIAIRYDTVSFALYKSYLPLIAAAPLVSTPIFIRLGLYRAVIRFVDQKILSTIVMGVSLSVIAMAAIASFTHIGPLSRGVFIIYWFAAVLYILASRFLARGYFLRITRQESSTRIAIYGAGEAGTQLANALRSSHEYSLAAFIDDKRERSGMMIAGVRVWSPERLPDLIVKESIKEILLAMPSLSKAQQKRILDKLEPLKVKIKVTPGIQSLVKGELRLQDIREVEIEDLLWRDTVDPKPELISRCIAGKSVLVTGAGGSIGSELCRQIIKQRPSRLLLLEISEFALYSIEQELIMQQQAAGLDMEILPFLGSVMDEDKCRQLLLAFSVNTVYHAAAYKHVPLVEHNPIEGIRNNVFGTWRIAKAAMVANVKSFVLVSTDKAVRPTNVMGATKRLAELILQGLSKQRTDTRFCMVRFGNVLGSSGSVVPLFRKQIMAGGPITVTHPEITRYFMTIPEAAQLVLQAGAMSTGGDVFVLDMGEPIKIVDLAKRMVHLSGLEVKTDLTPDGTIEIEHVGLRPGEKLYEELLIGSNAEGTEHPLIMRAQETEIPWAILEELLQNLDKACDELNYETVRALLLRSVAEYAPQCDIQDFLWLHKQQLNSVAVPKALMH